MKSDLLPVLQATLAGRLEEIAIEWLKARSVCVVLAARGYPGEHEAGRPISGLDAAQAMDGVEVFHAGTKPQEGKFVTAGGRVLAVTALGASFADAAERAYAAVRAIGFDGKQFRTDIAQDAIEALSHKD
jgi:phosphoribosylamine--glycine ligase